MCGAISRVMSFKTIICLGRLLPAASSDLPGDRTGRPMVSIFGLASDGVYMATCCYQRHGGLLHRLFTLTTFVAVIFCCTFLRVTSTGRYPASCPAKPGLSSPAAFRFCSRDHLSCMSALLYYQHPFVFASTFWTKLQNIFGHCCMSKLDKVAKPRLAAYKPAESHCRHYLIVTA